MNFQKIKDKILGIDAKIEDYNEAGYEILKKNRDDYNIKLTENTNVFEPDKIRNNVFWGTNPYELTDIERDLFDKASAQVAKEDFYTSILSAKIGILLFLVLIIFVYQVYFVKLDSDNKTFFNDPRTVMKPIIESGIAAFIGAISIFIVNLMRLGLKNSLKWERLKVYITIFIVIFLFDISEEASGFNRYMANISKTNEEYKELNDRNDKNEPIEKEKTYGDPFLTSIAYVTISLGILAIIYFIFNMIRSTIRGKISGMNSVTQTGGGWGIFSIELFIVVVLNFSGSLLAKLSTGGVISTSTYFSSYLFAIIAFSLQIMSQYTGVSPAFDSGKKLLNI